MARKIEIELIGNDQSLQRAFKRSAHGAKTFEHDIGKASRGAIAASLSFRGLGRSAAYASGYLIGGAGLAYGLKSSVEGAESLEKAQRSLGVVIRRNGGNFKDQLPAIEHWAAAQARFGVSTVTSEQGLARATVITGSAVKGMRAYTEALEISKATGRSFTTVLLAAAKANEGQTTALARYIGKIPTGTSALKLFTDIQAKYKGQAEANTTATEKLGASLSNIETTVGTALLPTLNKYSDELTKWLSKSKNQASIQRTVNTVVGDGIAVVHDIAGAFRTAKAALAPFNSALGGTRHSVKLLAGAFAAWKLGALPSLLNAVRASIAGIGGAAAIATPEVNAFKTAEERPDFGPGGAGGGGGVVPFFPKGRDPSNPIPNTDLRTVGTGGLLSRLVPAAGELRLGGAGLILPGLNKDSRPGVPWKNGAIFKQGGKKFVVHADANGVLLGLTPAGQNATAKPTPGRGFRDANLGGNRLGAGPHGGLDSLSQIQNAVSNARVGVARGDKGAQASLVAALKAQIDYDRKYEGIQTGLIKRRVGDVKKHAQTLQQLQSDEVSALDEITSMNHKTQSAEDKAAKAAVSAAKKAAAAAKKRREAAKRAAEKRNEEAQTFTIPIALQIAQAQAAATPETTDDVKVSREIATYALKVIKSNKKKGQAIVDAWNEITNQMQTFAEKQTNAHSVATSSAKLTSGLHLASAVRKELEARFAQAEAHGGRVPIGHAVGGVTIGTVHVHGVKDADHLIAQIQAKARHAAVQTRGPNAGRNPRVH